MRKDLVRQSFNKAADNYDSASDFQQHTGQTLLSYITTSLNNLTVLDLGSGTGFITEKIRQLYSSTHLISIDIAEKMLINAKRNSQASLAICSDAENLAIKSNSIDMIISNLTLQWCMPIEKTLLETHRTLKPKGQFLFTTLGANTLKELKEQFNTIDDRPHINTFTNQATLEMHLNNSGFLVHSLTTQSIVWQYSSLYALMQRLKAIGAINLNEHRSKGLMGKTKYKQLMESTKAISKTFSATYEVIYAHCTRK